MRKIISPLLLAAALLAPGAARSQTPLDELNRAARLRVDATPRVALAKTLPGEVASLEPVGSGRTPNYLLAFAAVPEAAAPFSRLIKSVLEDGALEPELKMAMGLRIANPTAASTSPPTCSASCAPARRAESCWPRSTTARRSRSRRSGRPACATPRG